MSTMTMTQRFSIARVLPVVAAVFAMLLPASAHAAAPGIAGLTFNLTAQDAHITQPDGQSIYSWGYGCSTGFTPTFAPKPGGADLSNAKCPAMQIPGPTLIVNQGDLVTVNLTNNLPLGAGNTSILFPGFIVTTTGGTPGLLTQEASGKTSAAAGGTVQYQFTASTPGTRPYYSGTQGDLQVEMGLYGAVIVLPTQTSFTCPSDSNNLSAEAKWGESDFRLAKAAYNFAASCYDREYLFQFSEIDPRIHSQAETQVKLIGACATNCAPAPTLDVQTEPYHPNYFMVNGRSMPDDMDQNYAVEYPHQPYNGNPHMHPGELVLLRIIGQGRWQHPFHEHGNHVRILARDGNPLLTATNPPKLAGPLLFTTTTTPGVAMDGIFYWTGKGLNWDVYGHHGATDPANTAALPCMADANGYNTGDPTALNYYEWCADHNKPLEKAPFGDVGGGGPATLPDPNYLTNGTWYGGSAYLGPDAATRGTGPTGTTPPSGTPGNPTSSEAGFAFMWHSHNEREITTNNVFPGGMMMMMLVDSREYQIDESN